MAMKKNYNNEYAISNVDNDIATDICLTITCVQIVNDVDVLGDKGARR